MQLFFKPIPWARMARAGLLVSVSFCTSLWADDVTLKDEQDKTSYSIGANVGKNLKKQSVSIRIEPFMKGLNEALAGKNTLMTEKDMDSALIALQQKIVAAENQKRQTAAEENKKKSQAFLDENKSKPNVVTLSSGLQYQIIKSGPENGKKPDSKDAVVTHYKGTLIDGTEFDSSIARGQPATFPVSAVIPGWTEALQLMKPGDKWKLFIPPQLAYGEQGMGAKIGPNEALIFEIELIGVKKTEDSKK